MKRERAVLKVGKKRCGLWRVDIKALIQPQTVCE